MVGQSVRRQTGPGCFTYGCLIAAVLFSVLIGGIWLYAKRSMREAVDRHLSSVPSPLSSVSYSETDADEGMRKINLLRSAINENRAESVMFSSADLQGAIGATSWKDWIRVELNSDFVNLRFSLPLAALGEWEAATRIVDTIKDRFLTGSARCLLSIKEGEIRLSFSELTLRDRKLEDMPRGHAAEYVSGAIMALAKDDASTMHVLNKLQEVSVIDGKLQVRVKSQ